MTETLHGPTPGTDMRQIPVIAAVNSFHSSSENAASPVKPSRSRWIFRSRTLPPSIAVRRVAPSITVGERDAARKSSRCGQVSGSIRIVLELVSNLRMKALRRGEKAPQCRHDTSGSLFGFKKVLHAIRVWLIRTEDSWVGDLIGVVSIFAALWGGLLIGHAMTGGAQ